MSNEERYKKYVKENCKNCRNKTSDECEIRISELNGIVTTKCIYYENENKKQNKIKAKNWQVW